MACADLPEKEPFSREQMECFELALGMVSGRGHQPRWIHQANGAAAHAFPESRGNLIRPGGVLYGLWRDVTNRGLPPMDWRPVLTLKTRIELIKTVGAGVPLGYGGTFVTSRESRIATLPIGYQDGLSRGLSNRGEVLIRGQRAKVAGRISMDLTLIDVTDVPDLRVGDEVVLIGSDGNQTITAEELAGLIGAISYEVTCGISERVPRVYLDRT
jgi:alanine racemase